MSKIGKKPIQIPKDAKIKVESTLCKGSIFSVRFADADSEVQDEPA